MTRGWTVVWCVAAVLLGVTACSGAPHPDASPRRTTVSSAAAEPAPPAATDAVPAKLRAAVSRPEHDSVYFERGDPRIDALHYDLTLDWAPATRTLAGHEVLTLRATANAAHVQLDLTDALVVSRARVDGRPAGFEQAGDLLTVEGPFGAGTVYRIVLEYAGTPRPAATVSDRRDLDQVGFSISGDDQVTTLQEPVGAFTWYAANDQPSDKAFYDFTLRVPAPWVGVANGQLLSRGVDAGDTVTRWHLDQPGSSYLVALAFGPLTLTRAGDVDGVPITYWTPIGDAATLRRIAATPRLLAWVQRRLGPYPFASLGILVPEYFPTGMETQTMISLSARFPAGLDMDAVLVHEIVHQWYGDEVTPSDWRDMWMNEGMAMYIQKVWEAERDGRTIERVIQELAPREAGFRRQFGPPGAYERRSFAQGNVYYGPAMMWDTLRRRVGDETFWRLVRTWPTVHRYGNASREDLVAWFNEQTGQDLTSFFQAWLMDEKDPPLE